MNKLFLFDVDGTLAPSAGQVPQTLVSQLVRLVEQGHHLGLVSGGTYSKLMSQVGGPQNAYLFEWVFAENATVVYHYGVLVEQLSLRRRYVNEQLDTIVEIILAALGRLTVPFKRGSFLRFRNGMMYVTPVGGDVTTDERALFSQYDAQYGTRRQLIDDLLPRLTTFGLTAKFGGQIGVAVHPVGWDKARVFEHITLRHHEAVLFYGDRCDLDGNDYPLFVYPGVQGHHVTGPGHTLELLEQQY
jgi:phosphomannomutase